MSEPLFVVGRKIESPPQPSLLRPKLHEIQLLHAIEVGVARDEGSQRIELEGAADGDLVELVLEDGSTLITSVEGLRDLMRRGVRVRGDEGNVITGWLPFASAERGVGAVALKILKLFRAPAVKAIANVTTRAAVEKIEQKIATPGLYRLDDGGGLKERVAGEVGLGAPNLVFIHGTGSSTRGSFQGLFAAADDWGKLLGPYKGRIFALEHATLSASPVDNALALAKLFANGSELHLVTHSRGGLVGELLCRGGFGGLDLDAFRNRPNRPQGELEALLELGEKLTARKYKIGRFVRVACPAAGTVLASDRLDFYLSLLLNAIAIAAPEGVDTLVEGISDVLLEVAQRRADPSELPGLEAQRPDSPLIHFLNGGAPGPVDQDLAVIEGDLRFGSVRETLRAVAAYTFFLQKNDLVVDTKSMRRGLSRSDGGWYSDHESPAVTHFSYFTEQCSRKRLVDALLHNTGDRERDGFKSITPRAQDSGGNRGASSEVDRGKLPVVLFLPDYFGTSLSNGKGRVWPDAARIASDGLHQLDLAAAPCSLGPPSVGALVERLDKALLKTHQFEIVPYDWRNGIDAGSAALVARLEKATNPVDAVVGHGLGGLSILAAAARDEASWKRFVTKGRAVLLGPPLAGAEFVLRMALASGPLFRVLDALDGKGTSGDLANLILSWPGTLDLLPDRALDPMWWRRLGSDAPAEGKLEAAAKQRKLIRAAADGDAIQVVFGCSSATLSLELDADDELKGRVRDDGDGWAVRPTGTMQNRRTFFVPGNHEQLPSNPDAVAVVADLINKASPPSVAAAPPQTGAPRDEPEVSRFPSQEDLEILLGRERVPLKDADSRRLSVRMAHGSLDRLGHPVIVGHYRGDGIIGAEAVLDRALDGALKRLHGAGQYPGAAGSVLYVPEERRSPRGALILGLGDIGDLTTESLTDGIRSAAVQYALSKSQELPQNDDESKDEDLELLTLTSLLIGTRGGQQLSVSQAVVAITNGILGANRSLSATYRGAGDGSAAPQCFRRAFIDTLCFVELWEDIAIEAGHAVRRVALEPGLDLRDGETIDARGGLMTLDGRRGPSRSSGEWKWWRRLIISAQRGSPGMSTVTGLRFTTITERARADDESTFTVGPTLDELFRRAQSREGEAFGLSISNALYEVALPQSAKSVCYDGGDLVLVVDEDTAHYAWELLARRRGDRTEPLIDRLGIVRQFRGSATASPARATGNSAIVIGNPQGVIPSLEGAVIECTEVAQQLAGSGFAVTELNEQPANIIVERLFTADYRILHIAAHGNFDAQDPKHSGVIIGRTGKGDWQVLNAQWIEQLPALPELVFLNCCHLAQTDTQPDPSPRLAASISQKLIQMGVRCVVAAGWAVNDRAARIFAAGFYRKMLEGFTFGDAVLAARREVWRTMPQGTTWAAYQCYGDPLYHLPIAKPEKPAPRRFVSPLEAQGECEDVHAAVTTAGTNRKELDRQREQLMAIEEAIPSDWADSGALWYVRAIAWDALGESVRTLDYLGRALERPDAATPIRAAEIFANRLARHAEQLSTGVGSEMVVRTRNLFQECTWAGKISDGANAKVLARRCVTIAMARVDDLLRIGKTPERYGILGSCYKSLATIASNPKTRAALLDKSVEAYTDGVELACLGKREAPAYPGIPAIAVIWVAGQAVADRLPTLRRWTKGIRKSAEAGTKLEGATFWNVVSAIDAELLAYLLEGKPDKFDPAKLGSLYVQCLNRYGTDSEKDSVLRMLAFLKIMAGASKKPGVHAFAQPLETLFDKVRVKRSSERKPHE